MADKWRFDPYKDYTTDEDYSDRRDNFQKFKPKKNKNKKSDDGYNKGKKKKSWR